MSNCLNNRCRRHQAVELFIRIPVARRAERASPYDDRVAATFRSCLRTAPSTAQTRPCSLRCFIRFLCARRPPRTRLARMSSCPTDPILVPITSAIAGKFRSATARRNVPSFVAEAGHRGSSERSPVPDARQFGSAPGSSSHRTFVNVPLGVEPQTVFGVQGTPNAC